MKTLIVIPVVVIVLILIGKTAQVAAGNRAA